MDKLTKNVQLLPEDVENMRKARLLYAERNVGVMLPRRAIIALALRDFVLKLENQNGNP